MIAAGSSDRGGHDAPGSTTKRGCVVTSVCGCLAKDLSGLSQIPPVIVNPSATAFDLLGWCLAEERSLDAVVNVASTIPEGLSDDLIWELLAHRTGPLIAGLRHVAQLLKAAEGNHA